MTTSDDGLREIQLNGKQLVFLFMAVTVVSVVIFLCGVLVGRGVQARTGPIDTPAPTSQESDAAGDAGVPPATTPGVRTKADDLVYSERLQSTTPSPEKLVPQPEPKAVPAPSTSAPANDPAKPVSAAPAREAAAKDVTKPAAPKPEPATANPVKIEGAKTAAAAPPAAAAKPIPPEPKGDGVAIQVAALRGQGEAEAVVSRLKGKGYSAYLLAPVAGQPTMFRVRVGKFKTRAEAEKVAGRLEKEEQFKPWITR